MAEVSTHSATGASQNLFSDVERLLGDKLGQLRDEVMGELGKLVGAGSALGTGAGMAVLGTLLGGIGFVHLIHRVTGLPLWLCYAGSSAIACSVASGLVATGVKKVSDLDIIPEGTGRALREAVVGGKR